MNFSSLKKCMLLSLAVIAIGSNEVAFSMNSGSKNVGTYEFAFDNSEDVNIVNSENVSVICNGLKVCFCNALKKIDAKQRVDLLSSISTLFTNSSGSLMDFYQGDENLKFNELFDYLIQLPSIDDIVNNDGHYNMDNRKTELECTNMLINCVKLVSILNNMQIKCIDNTRGGFLHSFINLIGGLDYNTYRELINKKLSLSFDLNHDNGDYSIFADFIRVLVNSSSYTLSATQLKALCNALVYNQNTFAVAENSKVLYSYYLNRQANNCRLENYYLDEFANYLANKQIAVGIAAAVGLREAMTPADMALLVGHVIFQPQNAELVQEIIEKKIIPPSPITSVGDLSMFLLDVVNNASDNLTNGDSDEGKSGTLTNGHLHQTRSVKLTEEQKKERIKRFQNCAINTICNQYGYEVVNMEPENEYFMGSFDMESNTVDIQKDKLPVARRLSSAISSHKNSFTVRLPHDNQALKDRILKEGFMGCFPENELNNNTKSIRVFFIKKEK